MGSKGSQTTTNTNQTQSYSANPVIAGAGTQAIGMAANAASQPFQMPVAPVAGFSPDQLQAFQQYQQIQGIQNPYNNQAANMYATAGQAVDPATVNQYYQPEITGVMSQLKDLYGQQQSQNTGNLIQSAGGVGADRIAVGQAQLANQQDLAAGQTAAGVYQSAVAQAQADKARQAGVASGIAGLGGQALSEGLQGTGALFGAGTTEQQQTQAELNAPYQNQLARLAYPFQTAQYLAGITGGLSGALGGTTNQVGQQVTTPPQPSLLSQLFGIGTAGVGLYNSFNSNSGGGGTTNLGNLNGGGFPSYVTNAARGGAIEGYDNGGETDESQTHIPGITNAAGLSPIPYIPVQSPAQNHTIAPMPAAQSQSQSQNSLGSDIANVAKTAAAIIPFLKRGGAAYDGSGPFPGQSETDFQEGKYGAADRKSRMVQGYDDGGMAPADNNPDMPSYDPSRPVTGKPIPNLGPWPFNKGYTPVGGGGQVVMYPNATPSAASPLTPQSPIPFPGATGQTPLPSPPPPPPITHKAAPASHPSVVAAGDDDDDTGTSGAHTSGLQLPYPDALDRNAGQQATRSPWMALVQAGATMAATPGPLGVSLGKGMLAGVKGLDDQRKELRSEQELNDKAKELYEKVKEHQDKYNKMTPYERASIAVRNKELDQEAEGVSGKPGKFTGADYDRAAKWVAERYPGLSAEQLQPLITAEVARRRHAIATGTTSTYSPPESKPQTVVQNGHTYTLQADGTYQ